MGRDRDAPMYKFNCPNGHDAFAQQDEIFGDKLYWAWCNVCDWSNALTKEQSDKLTIKV